MKISINFTNYHLHELTKEEIKFSNKVESKLLSRYPTLIKDINKSLLSYKISINKEYKYLLKKKLTFANLKSLEDKFEYKDIDDKKAYKELYKNIINTLPLAVINDKFFQSERYFIYEPINIIGFYLTNSFYNASVKDLPNINKNDGILSYKKWIIIDILRSIRSSYILFSIGDDVHGISLYRGIIEQIARLILLEKDKSNNKEYIEFTKMNALVQMYKINSKLSLDSSLEVNKFLEKNKLTLSTCENYLLYSWYKTNKNKRISSATELIKEAFTEDQQAYLDLYHFASEFIHEDYVAVGYDYISLRIKSKELLIEFLNIIYGFIKKYKINVSNKNKDIYKLLKEYN